MRNELRRYLHWAQVVLEERGLELPWKEGKDEMKLNLGDLVRLLESIGRWPESPPEGFEVD